MGKKIEFETVLARTGGPYDNLMLAKLRSLLAQGKIRADHRYHVTLQPIEPEPKPCPNCGNGTYVVYSPCFERAYSVECDECHDGCGLRGPVKTTRNTAVEAYNELADKIEGS